jgi:hypothetical protein
LGLNLFQEVIVSMSKISRSQVQQFRKANGLDFDQYETYLNLYGIPLDAKDKKEKVAFAAEKKADLMKYIADEKKKKNKKFEEVKQIPRKKDAKKPAKKSTKKDAKKPTKKGKKEEKKKKIDNTAYRERLTAEQAKAALKAVEKLTKLHKITWEKYKEVFPDDTQIGDVEDFFGKNPKYTQYSKSQRKKSYPKDNYEVAFEVDANVVFTYTTAGGKTKTYSPTPNRQEVTGSVNLKESATMEEIVYHVAYLFFLEHGWYAYQIANLVFTDVKIMKRGKTDLAKIRMKGVGASFSFLGDTFLRFMHWTLLDKYSRNMFQRTGM